MKKMRGRTKRLLLDIGLGLALVPLMVWVVVLVAEAI